MILSKYGAKKAINWKWMNYPDFWKWISCYRRKVGKPIMHIFFHLVPKTKLANNCASNSPVYITLVLLDLSDLASGHQASAVFSIIISFLNIFTHISYWCNRWKTWVKVMACKLHTSSHANGANNVYGGGGWEKLILLHFSLKK